MFYAHSKRDPITRRLLPKTKWHLLPKHLEDTARRAGIHAEAFGCAELGQILGYMHDYGKATPQFIKRLEGSRQNVDHKTAGTVLAANHYPFPYGMILAYAIYGHHGGLPNFFSSGDTSLSLDNALKNTGATVNPDFQPTLPSLSLQLIPKCKRSNFPGLSFSLFIRMLYSSLIDADYLDTEQYFTPEKSALRSGFLSIEQMCENFSSTLNHLLAKPQDNRLARARNHVLQCCRRASKQPSRIFTLTVPTGGGKTLSSLAFALEHAKEYNKRRIIYALPFLSIIEQNSDVFREALGEYAVLEHHSNIESTSDDEMDVNKLASENWEAGFIVTTTVQLFESLFAAKPARARKLHNLANSIIILDEAQMIPQDFLLPSLAALKCLSDDFGVTVVLCTATQPAIQPSWFNGVKPTEIMDNPQELYCELKRVKADFIGFRSNAQVTDMLLSNKQALCIVNVRKQAQSLFKKLPEGEGYYHLSALMCPKHRAAVLEEVKVRLRNKQRCIVIATSLLEAGVDIDFPVVYREVAGIDSLAQAAGRCNREGDPEKEPGQMYVYEPMDYSLPRGWFSRVAGYAKEVIKKYGEDFLQPEAVKHYFELSYMNAKHLDEHDILRNLNKGANQLSFQFREIADKFRFINSDTISLVIPFDDNCKKLIEEARQSFFPGSYSRRLQRYSVAVTLQELESIRAKGKLRDINQMIYYLNDEKNELYHNKLGLCISPEEW